MTATATVRSSSLVLALLVVAILFCGSSAMASPQKQKLKKNYQDWIDRDVTYIISKDERNAFLRLDSDEARDKFIQDFWEARNPTPGSPDNSYKDDIYRRIAYANATFGSGVNGQGWRTDRGRAYITLGPPQQKEVHYNAANLFPIEIWFYSGGQPALPPFFYLMFYQKEGVGDFRFYSPYIDGPDKLVTGTEAINDRQTALKMISDSVGPEVARRTLSLLPDEPVDMTNATVSLQSDVMLSTLKNLPNNPLTKRELDRRRGALESVTSRLVLAGQTLDVATLPVRDSHGLPRLDYMMRFRNPSDFSLTDRGDGKYSYSVEARVRVFDADHNLVFAQLRTISDTVDRRQVDDIKDKRFGYEGSLPLPPGKYHLDFLLTDWQKKAAFQAEKDVVVPPISENDFVISGVLPFSQAAPADPATADVTPFALAGVKFTPLGTAPLILNPAESLQVAYQIWTAPRDPRAYAGSVLNVEYALGRPAVPGGATLVTDQVNKEQFDPAGSLVNGKRFSLSDESTGNYMLTVTVKQGGISAPAFTTLGFSILGTAPVMGVWDISDPSLQKDLQMGLADQDRALCYLAQGKKDEARIWFRRALDRDRTNDMARARLVDAYYVQKDYAAVTSLYKDAGITSQTDSETILRVAQSFRESGDLPKAIAALESALVTRADEGPLYLALAGYYEQVGNAQKAADLRRKGQSLLNPAPGKK